MRAITAELLYAPSASRWRIRNIRSRYSLECALAGRIPPAPRSSLASFMNKTSSCACRSAPLSSDIGRQANGGCAPGCGVVGPFIALESSEQCHGDFSSAAPVSSVAGGKNAPGLRANPSNTGVRAISFALQPRCSCGGADASVAFPLGRDNRRWQVDPPAHSPSRSRRPNWMIGGDTPYVPFRTAASTCGESRRHGHPYQLK